MKEHGKSPDSVYSGLKTVFEVIFVAGIDFSFAPHSMDHAPPVSDMPHETAETQRNQQKRRHDVPPDGG
ncbi:hypothetical protein [Bifidobacterium pseudocatenulatum]|uniref:hypothetical protein n=1 Tax=Bifidobacterium pseudocatenulatum TaxID=28026 RepID=UPI00232C7D3B|nr:hypothetical protein [Bifidobacterium pseudocatenulatum]